MGRLLTATLRCCSGETADTVLFDEVKLPSSASPAWRWPGLREGKGLNMAAAVERLACSSILIFSSTVTRRISFFGCLLVFEFGSMEAYRKLPEVIFVPGSRRMVLPATRVTVPSFSTYN